MATTFRNHYNNIPITIERVLNDLAIAEFPLDDKSVGKRIDKAVEVRSEQILDALCDFLHTAGSTPAFVLRLKIQEFRDSK